MMRSGMKRMVAWFAVEIRSITYVFAVNGIRMPFFNHIVLIPART